MGSVTKPIIGVTLNWQEHGDYSPFPYFVMREHYFEAIDRAGGIPIAIPFIPGAIEEYMKIADGFIFPGGDFALDPSWYINTTDKSPYAPSPRLEFDKAIMMRALELDKPFLGICAGMQILAGVMGCKLTPNIIEYAKTVIDHRDQQPRDQYAHKIAVVPHTQLRKIVDCDEFDANTSHREAVVKVIDPVIVSASAEDGVIEAIEVKGKNFALAVQWHPEFFLKTDGPHFKIFQKLIEVSRHP